ncbi:MAG: choice-of-anchor Q domain-containing protein [Planctomycetota bacterium]|jgi:predicted outer membrane repeat protein
MKHKKITICLLVVLIAGSVTAALRNVPQQYTTIQAAINACDDFDTVIVAPGTYSGSGNQDINFNGKSIMVRSTDPTDPHIINSTIVDCEGEKGFVFNTWETPDSTITGLTITNAYGGLLGGAVSCSNNSSPSIINCVFINNSAIFGGAIACTNTNTRPKITGCKIVANSALFGGGAIYCSSASPKITNSIIIANSAQYGGAIYSHNAGEPVIINCTITENTAAISAGGIYCYKSSNMTVTNTILWNNTAASAAEIFVGNSGANTSIQLSYCNIQDPVKNIVCGSGCVVNWGPGNIDQDPLFVETESLTVAKINSADTNGDYHLLGDSPCIDAGDPDFIPTPGETDIDGNPRIAGEKIDIGADEFLAAIDADIRITPRTLNLTSNGNWINCTISLGAEHNIADVNTAGITLNNNEIIGPMRSKVDEQEQKLLVKFDRTWVQSILSTAAESPVPLIVAGELYDGTKFEGTDMIRVLWTGAKK